MAYTNLIACRVCGNIFRHVVLLLYHFDQVHRIKSYIPPIQQNGKSTHEHIKLYIITI